MLKRLLSGSLALVMILSAGCLSAFAEEEYDPTEEDPYCEYVPSEEGELTAKEILGDILSDEEFVNSDNIMVQEMAEDMAELEKSGTDILGGEVAAPYWIADPWDPTNETTTHANIVKALRSHLSSDYTEAGKDQIIALMIFSVNIADKGPFHDINSPVNERATQLHAVDGTNYLTNLKILWKYSKLAPSYNNTETENQIRSSMKNLNTKDKQSMETLFGSIHTLYNTYKKEKNLNRVLTKRERKFLVMGFAIHLIGDIYAHATLVPKEYGIERTNNPYFNKNDFISSDHFNACMDAILYPEHENNFRTTEFIHYVKNSSTKPQNKYYEDNKNFMPERIKLAKYSAIKFISRIQTKGQTFSSDYVFRHYVTSDGVTYDVKLSLFDKLKERL